ncbi:MAG TPA: LLM class flavin-dependent oxidoreductase [Mycobacteriales bacterium]|nr:LLM class flavin-dependent oxidoreductase [Mycobacteriales bacterium]
MDLRVGTLILPSEPWADARETWQQAEEAGFDIAYTADHLTHPTMAGQWWADGWTTLAAAAGVTEGLQLGTLVASAAVRPPAVLARQSATLADLSGGRFVLGLGAGAALDAVAAGLAAPTPTELAARFESVVADLRVLWAGGEPARDLGVAVAAHAPGVEPPHLMLAAHGPRAMTTVARHADGWSTYGGPKASGLSGSQFWDLVSTQVSGLEQACQREGREPASLRRSLLLGWSDDRPLSSLASFTAAADQALALGFDELVVYWPQGQPGARFWADPEVVRECVRSVRTA